MEIFLLVIFKWKCSYYESKHRDNISVVKKSLVLKTSLKCYCLNVEIYHRLQPNVNLSIYVNQHLTYKLPWCH